MRNSSVELYRIIATLLVLTVHFNGYFVGMTQNFSGWSSFAISQDIIESISIICVNCFLVITGWYGLKLKWRHVWTIWSILVCIYVPCYLATAIYSGVFSIQEMVLDIIALTKESYYVQCYLMLLFLSPILNTFIKKYGRNILPYTLAFWAVEIIFDWILQNKCLSFGRGYELTHFVFMYLLGQTAFLYKDTIYKYYKSKYCVIVFILGAILTSVMYLFIPYKFCFVYTNPINVIMSFSLFFLFERRCFYNKIINWISKSTLAVYILHVTPPIINNLQKWDIYVLTNFSYPAYLGLMLLTILVVFGCGILYDKIRILFMPAIGDIVCKWLNSKTKKYSLTR